MLTPMEYTAVAHEAKKAGYWTEVVGLPRTVGPVCHPEPSGVEGRRGAGRRICPRLPRRNLARSGFLSVQRVN